MIDQIRFRLLAGVLAVVTPVAALAQGADPKSGLLTFKEDLKGNQSIFAYDFGVPQSPSTLLLGLQSGSVSPVTSLKAFVAQLGSLGSGKFVGSLEISPAALFGLGNDLGRYGSAERGNYLYRLARRAHVGMTLLEGSTGEKPVKSGVAVGASIALLDSSDPWRVHLDSKTKASLLTCIDTQAAAVAPLFTASIGEIPYLPVDQSLGSRLELLRAGISDIRLEPIASRKEVWKSVPRELLDALVQAQIDIPDSKKPDDVFDGELQTVLKEVSKKINELKAPFYQRYEKQRVIEDAKNNIKACAKRASELAANGTDLSIGAGTFWRGKAGELAELRNGGGAVWMAFRTAIYQEPTAAWIFAVSSRYGLRETIATGDAVVATIRGDTLDGWAGIERRSSDLLGSARLGYKQVRANDAAGRFFNREGTRFLLNLQYKVDERLWLGVSYGNAGGSVDTYDAERFLLTLAFSPAKPDDIIAK